MVRTIVIEVNQHTAGEILNGEIDRVHLNGQRLPEPVAHRLIVVPQIAKSAFYQRRFKIPLWPLVVAVDGERTVVEVENIDAV